MTEIMTWLSAHWIELFGTITGLGAVFFLARNKGLLGWTFGIINAVFFMVLMYQYNLYADLTLNAYYFVTGIMGLIVWSGWSRFSKKERKPAMISHLDARAWAVWIAVWLVGSFAMGYVLDTYTASDIAYVDSFTTVGSFIAQYMLARKIFDNWYIWIFVDVIDIGLYAYKGLYLVTAMTVIYMVLCVMGIYKWNKDEAIEEQTGEAVVRDLEVVLA